MNPSVFCHREDLCRKLESNFQSIIAKYDCPFPDDDEIDLNTLNVTTNKGKLEKLRAPMFFGRTPLQTEKVVFGKQESTDSALGSTKYSDSDDGTSDDSYASDGDAETDSDGSGPCSPQRKECWWTRKKIETKNPFRVKASVSEKEVEDYYFNTTRKKFNDKPEEEVSDRDSSCGEVPSILLETSKFVERVQTFILENSDTSSDEDFTEVHGDSGEHNFKSSLVSGTCKNSNSTLQNSKPSFMNMTYNIDNCSSVSEEPAIFKERKVTQNIGYAARFNAVSEEPKLKSNIDHSARLSAISEEPKLRSYIPHSARLSVLCKEPMVRSNIHNSSRFDVISEEPKVKSYINHSARLNKLSEERKLRANIGHSARLNAVPNKPKVKPNIPHSTRFNAISEEPNTESNIDYSIRLSGVSTEPKIKSNISHSTRLNAVSEDPNVKSNILHSTRVSVVSKGPTVKSTIGHSARITTISEEPTVKSNIGHSSRFSTEFEAKPKPNIEHSARVSAEFKEPTIKSNMHHSTRYSAISNKPKVTSNIEHSARFNTVSEEPELKSNIPHSARFGSVFKEENVGHSPKFSAISEEPKLKSNTDCTSKRCSRFLKEPKVNRCVTNTTRCNAVSEEPKIMSNMDCCSARFNNISEKPQFLLSKPDISKRKLNSKIVETDKSEKQHKTHLQNNILKGAVKLNIDTKNNDENFSPISSKCEYSKDVLLSPACLRVDTPRPKLYLNPKFTTPATPGCTTEELIQFLNSPLDVLIEQSNARADIAKSSKNHFTFSPKELKAETNQRHHTARKWRPQSNSTEIESIEIDAMEVEPMELDTIIESPIRDQKECRKTALSKTNLANNSLSLLVSPLGHLNVESPQYSKDQNSGHGNRRNGRKSSINKRQLINEIEFLEHVGNDRSERSDDIIPLSMSDDDSPEEKQLICATKSPENHAHDFGIKKIKVHCKNGEDQRLFSKSKQNGPRETNFIKPVEGNVIYKSDVNKFVECSDQTKQQKIKNNDVWWMKTPSAPPKKETRIIKTAARTTSSSTATQEVNANNTYSWFVDKHPEESSIYSKDISSISMLSAIPDRSLVHCPTSTPEALSDEDDDIIISSTQDSHYCSPKKMSYGANRRNSRNIHLKNVKTNHPVIRTSTPPKMAADTPVTVRTLTPTRIRTSTPPKVQTSTPTVRSSTSNRIRTSTPPKIGTSTTPKVQTSTPTVRSSTSTRIRTSTPPKIRNSTPPNIRTSTPRKSRPGLVAKRMSRHVVNDKPTFSTDAKASNLSGSFSCTGNAVCGKSFCFNCAFT